MRYLVALGEEEQKNKTVLDVALRHAVPRRDCVLLVKVIEELKPDPAIVLLDILGDDEEQIKLEESAKKQLEVYDKDCKDAGIDCAFLVLVDDHPGNALCKAAKDHKVDCIVLGRRNLGTFKRLISFSTSKYCMDNAECNVIVVKRPYSEEDPTHHTPEQVALSQGEKDQQHQPNLHTLPAHSVLTLRNPEEMKRSIERTQQAQKQLSDLDREIIQQEKAASQADLELVKKLEEEERRERLKEKSHVEEVERVVRRSESKRDLILTRKLEEEERHRRISDMYGEDQPAKKDDKKKSLASTRALEEKERQERIKAWQEEDVQEEEKRRQESIKDRQLIAKLEEEERASRLTNLKKEEEKERKRRTLERSISLEKVHLAEEQERMERIRQLQEEEVREQVEHDISSREDRERVKILEDEEQARRIRNQQKLQRIRSEESQLDLQKVKELEEIERARRIEEVKSMRLMQ